MLHYITEGERAGCKPCQFFDPTFYAQKYKKSDDTWSPLEHFLAGGWRSGNAPHAGINFALFLSLETKYELSDETLFSFFDKQIVRSPLHFASHELAFDTKQLRSNQYDAQKHANMHGARFYAPFSNISGLGEAARGYFQAFSSVGALVASEDCTVTPQQKRLKFKGNFVSKDWPVALALFNADSIGNFFTLKGKEFLAAQYRIALWVWELPTLNPEWMINLHPFDEIWVPSQFVQHAVQVYTNKPVELFPYILEIDESKLPLAADIRSRFDIPVSAFMFLYAFDASSYLDRKNPEALLSSFSTQFAGDKDTVLVLKISYSQKNKELALLLEKYKQKLGSQLIIVDQVLSPEDVRGLIRATDCYVSPHRSEGFGLTLAEAMLLGRPVIGTNFSGVCDFLNEETGYPCSYSYQEIKKSIGPYSMGAVWAEVDRQELSRLMGVVKSNYAEALMKATVARARLSEQLSAKTVGARMQSRLEAIYDRMKKISARSL